MAQKRARSAESFAHEGPCDRKSCRANDFEIGGAAAAGAVLVGWARDHPPPRVVVFLVTLVWATSMAILFAYILEPDAVQAFFCSWVAGGPP